MTGASATNLADCFTGKSPAHARAVFRCRLAAARTQVWNSVICDSERITSNLKAQMCAGLLFTAVMSKITDQRKNGTRRPAPGTKLSAKGHRADGLCRPTASDIGLMDFAHWELCWWPYLSKAVCSEDTCMHTIITIFYNEMRLDAEHFQSCFSQTGDRLIVTV